MKARLALLLSAGLFSIEVESSSRFFASIATFTNWVVITTPSVGVMVKTKLETFFSKVLGKPSCLKSLCFLLCLLLESRVTEKSIVG